MKVVLTKIVLTGDEERIVSSSMMIKIIRSSKASPAGAKHELVACFQKGQSKSNY